jgi:hypothetical protein
VFPAVDVDASGTRKEDLLMSAEELKIVWKLRRVLHALDIRPLLHGWANRAELAVAVALDDDVVALHALAVSRAQRRDVPDQLT